MANRRSAVLVIPVALVAVGCAGIVTQPDPAHPSGLRTNATDAPSTQPTISQPIDPATITHGPRRSNKVALTFDADFSPYALERVRDGRYPKQFNAPVIDYLERHGIPATIFVTGMCAQQYPDELARIAANPLFEVENHTWNHDAWTSDCYHLPNITDHSEKRDQIRRTSRLLEDSTGRRPAYFRFPGLCHTRNDEKIVAAEGLQSVGVDVESSDAFAHDPSKTAAAMLSAIKPGSIVLMHLNGAPNAPVTALVLERLVPALAARGLAPVTLSDLIRPRSDGI